jgi:hypothetical protein
VPDLLSIVQFPYTILALCLADPIACLLAADLEDSLRCGDNKIWLSRGPAANTLQKPRGARLAEVSDVRFGV